jgi:RecA-family ATPase
VNEYARSDFDTDDDGLETVQPKPRPGNESQSSASSPPPEPLRIVCPTKFQGMDPPPRSWIVPEWIPFGVVTGLYGDGGVGKSLIAQQLQTATALGSAWLGLPVMRAASLGVYCEDDDDELWRRQCAINADYGIDHEELNAMRWVSRLGEDNLLMTFTRNGVGELTKFHKQVLETAIDLRIRLVIIDTVADTFGGNENDRSQVRQFVQRALGQIALKIDGSLICCAHPSRTGLSTGSGDSGSTGWNNAFRSRIYLRNPEPNPNEPPDPMARIIERKKANYASRNDEIKLHWQNGVIVPDGASTTAGNSTFGKLDAKDVFLMLLREMTDQSRHVSSSSRAGNYAPREFEKLPSDHRYGFRRADFERAMNMLFRDEKIRNAPYGRKGDERTKIVAADNGEA